MAIIATGVSLPYSEDVEDQLPKLAGPVVSGAVFPESSYLEPTTGQIWPR